MAYKPKYAQDNKKKPELIRTEVPQQPRKPVKKQRKGKLALFVMLGLLLIPLSCKVTYDLLLGMYETVGRPKQAVQAKTGDMTLLTDVEAFVAAEMENTRKVLTSSGKPEIGEEEKEVVPPVRKVYWIEEGAQVAPEPNSACYGETADQRVLQEILDEAAWLLEGQETYFKADQKLYENSIVRYYLDDSIFAITWQEVHDGSVYTFSEIKVSHPSQFRRHLAGGEYGSDMQYLTTEMAASVNAVVASAGDFYRFRDFGAVVYEGQARRVEGTYAETCYIDSKGDMHFTYGGDVLTVEDVQAFVDEHDIQFSLAFGPILVDNYQEVEHSQYGVGEINEGYARAALCQMDDLHYIVVAANTTGPYQEIPTVNMFRKNILATGCKMAYCLDGGQTATIVMNDELMNRPVYGQQRKISDIIYFATAVPNGGGDNG